MNELQTPRLRLILLTEQVLTASLDDRRELASSLTNFNMPADWFAEAEFIRMRRDQCRADPHYAPWAPRAIVLRASNEMIGQIGFHEPPNPQHLCTYGPNVIEFGYTIYVPFRLEGFATEAVRGLMTWAANEAGIETFVVSISPTNAPSHAIARRFGFTKVGEQMDEKDGLEEVFVLRSNAMPDKQSS